MANRKPLTDDEGEVRELTAEDFKHAISFVELPESERKLLASRRRGPQKSPTKEMISIRLSRDVVERLRASGRGWQARVDAHLRKWVWSEPALRAKAAKRK
jgi:uncharacterized protein (DUF4415 family)